MAFSHLLLLQVSPSLMFGGALVKLLYICMIGFIVIAYDKIVDLLQRLKFDTISQLLDSQEKNT